jgi:phage terminase large subunit-like protein
VTLTEEDPDRFRSAIRQAREAGDVRRLLRLTEGLEAANRWQPQPHQLPPEGDWWCWVFQGGAGTGKTDVGAWWMDQHMTGPACDRRLPGGHKALIAGPTYGDAITTCWKLPAGISAHNDRVQLTSRKEGTVALWPTGAEALFCGLHSEQDTELLRARAANCCTWWIDDAVIARRLAAAIDLIALRARAGPRPHGIVTSTPKPTAGWRHLIHQPEVIVTRGSSFDNRYLSAAHKRVIERFKGTRLEAQEVHGVLLDDFEGALWNRQRLDQYRRPAMGEPEQIVHDLGLTRIAVGIDPSTWDPDIGEDPGTAGEGTETGIVVAGIDNAFDPHVFVLEDASLRGSGEQWGRAGIAAYHRWHASYIVPETNAGGTTVLSICRLIDPSAVVYTDKNGKPGVRAAMAKRARAEPTAALYEQGRAHHVGTFPLLEAQMCFPAGTIVETPSGGVPIAWLRAGDWVLTRSGPARLAWAGCSGIADRLTRIGLYSGECLLATPDHLLLGIGGFVPAGSVERGDLLVVDANTPTRWPGAAAGGTECAPGTTAAPNPPRCCSTAPYGKPTAGRSPSASTSITATAIRPTIDWRTSCWSRQPNMPPSIPTAAFRRWAPSSAEPTPAACGTLDNRDGCAAPAAVLASPRPECEPVTARVTATSVLRRSEPVYDLTVDGPAEFIANSVIVHNCQWDPLENWSPDRIDALVWAVEALHPWAALPPGSAAGEMGSLRR